MPTAAPIPAPPPIQAVVGADPFLAGAYMPAERCCPRCESRVKRLTFLCLDDEKSHLNQQERTSAMGVEHLIELWTAFLGGSKTAWGYRRTILKNGAARVARHVAFIASCGYSVIEKLVGYLFRCRHRSLSQPMSPRWSVPARDTYVVCLDCGKRLPYDWQHARIAVSETTERLQPPKFQKIPH